MKIYREKNREKLREQAKEWYHKTKDSPRHKELRKLQYIKHSDKIKAKTKVTSKERRKQLKEEVIREYGGVCVCCGDNHIEFMTIDHINGGGRQHRKEINCGGGWNFYAWLKKNLYPKDEYRLLCFNCNSALGAFGYCPHQNPL